MNKPMNIPNSCYECKIVHSCDVLPRWGEKKLFSMYYYSRHENCPYTALLKRFAKLEGFDTKGLKL